jgi:hypothetical protein
MTTRAKIIVTVCVTLAVFWIGAYVSVGATEDGHGSYMPMILLFPFSSLVMAGIEVWMGDRSGDLAEWIVPAIGILQFTSYGLLFGGAWIRGYAKKSGVRLAIFHASSLVLFAGVLAIDYFRR